ncbi:MAG: Tfp pilus assembly protein FimT/FimU [Vicinamibacterales bacterium]
MAALLIALSVMSVMLSVAMPVWRQMVRREKEAELIFRGQQYARAIGLFQKRAGPGTLPPSIDLLVQQRFLRKKYKDPITGDDFQVLLAGQAVPGSAAATPRGRGAPPGRPVPGQTPNVGAGTPSGAVGGIQGVVSKSKDKSIRVYNGRSVYNEWAFVFVPQVQAAGAGGPGGGPGGPGRPGPGGGPPGTGRPGTGPGRQGGPAVPPPNSGPRPVRP